MNPLSQTYNSVAETIFNSLDVFRTVPWGYVWALAHDVFLFLDILLIAGIIYLLIELAPYRPAFVNNPRRFIRAEKKIPTLRTEGLSEKWIQIKTKAESAVPQSLSLAVIEADSFIDEVLKRMNLPGEHFADRLDKLGGEYTTVDGLWSAHRMRNELVHTPGYVLPEHDARKMLGAYEAFLKEIEVIE